MIDYRTLEIGDILIDKKVRTIGKVFKSEKNSKFIIWEGIPGFECVKENSHSWMSEVEYHPDFPKLGVLKYAKT